MHTEGGRSASPISMRIFESDDVAMNESVAKFLPVMKIRIQIP
jgi:hypothetical protein